MFAASAQSSPESRIIATPLPGGIADSAGRVGYVAGARGGIDAVDLATGRMLWHTGGNFTPLLLFNRKVIAQANTPIANEVRIVALDAQHGRQVSLSQPLVFPSWVSTASAGWGTTFRSQAYVEAGTLFFAWQATQRPLFGNPPAVTDKNSGIGPRPLQASGMARVDLITGAALMLPMPARSDLFSVGAPASTVTLGPRTFTVKEEAAAMNADSPRLLQCHDAASGKLLWQYPLRPRPQDRSHLIM